MFKEWADFGFERKKEENPSDSTNPDKPEPNDPIDSELVMKELKHLPPIGDCPPRWTWHNIMEWGDGKLGTVRVNISPLGSYKMIIRKLTKDLLGEKVWVCKKVVPFNESGYNLNEIPLANDVYDKVVEIHKEMLDRPDRNAPDFDKLVYGMVSATTRHHPSYCMFPMGVKKMNEDYYKIYFEFRGHGVETPGSGRAEQFDIDILRDKEKGLIRIWGYEIDSSMKQHSWQVQPSEFDEYFCPSQNIKTIIENVVNIFMTF